MSMQNLLTPVYGDESSHNFHTERLQCAIFLHATGRLRFLGCEAAVAGKVRFVFEDPDHIGDQLELELDRGVEVPATALFASQKYLRRKMSETLENRKNGALNNGQSS